MIKYLLTSSLLVVSKKLTPRIVESTTPFLVFALRPSRHPASIGRVIDVQAGEFPYQLGSKSYPPGFFALLAGIESYIRQFVLFNGFKYMFSTEECGR